MAIDHPEHGSVDNTSGLEPRGQNPHEAGLGTYSACHRNMAALLLLVGLPVAKREPKSLGCPFEIVDLRGGPGSWVCPNKRSTSL